MALGARLRYTECHLVSEIMHGAVTAFVALLFATYLVLGLMKLMRGRGCPRKWTIYNGHICGVQHLRILDLVGHTHMLGHDVYICK
eukprot:COSAG01_NODE_10366_length_2183_cov_7.518714_3_plen_86_part_00